MTRILIIRFSALGDTAMLQPVVKQLAEQYAQLSITVLSQQRFSALFEGTADNVTFAGADLRGKHKGFSGLRRLLRQIDYSSFDLVADMHNVVRSRYITACCALRGAKCRHINKQRAGRFLLTHGYHRPLTATYLMYADVLKRLGYPINPPAKPAKINIGVGIGIAPFAAHKGKCYPLDRMEQVIRKLSEEHIPVYLFGAPGDEAAVLRRWEQTYSDTHCVAGNNSLAEQLRLIAGLRLMLSMDSANMHLASLAGTRVVSIWGATHPMAGFLGIGQHESDCLQLPLGCRPCSIYGKRKCRYGDYRCLDIPVKDVLEHLLQAYKQCSNDLMF